MGCQPPHTRVLAKRGLEPLRQPFRLEPALALGVVVDDEAVSFPFAELERAPLAHTLVAGQPVLVVYIKPAATAVAFGRQMGGRVLTFRSLAPQGPSWWMQDEETGTRWNALTGEAMSGPLDGAALRPVPATQAYLDSWRRLYPGGRLWRAPP